MGQVIKFPKRRQLRLLICDTDDLFVEVLTGIIEKAFGDRYTINVTSKYHGDQVLAFCQKHKCEIFILALNNIVFAPQHRLEPLTCDTCCTYWTG